MIWVLVWEKTDGQEGFFEVSDVCELSEKKQAFWMKGFLFLGLAFFDHSFELGFRIF